MTHHKAMLWKIRKLHDGVWALFDPNGRWVCSNETWRKTMNHAPRFIRWHAGGPW
jgi:hypothetical protein